MQAARIEPSCHAQLASGMIPVGSLVVVGAMAIHVLALTAAAVASAASSASAAEVAEAAAVVLEAAAAREKAEAVVLRDTRSTLCLWIQSM